jgi:hypothetical protein
VSKNSIKCVLFLLIRVSDILTAGLLRILPFGICSLVEEYQISEESVTSSASKNKPRKKTLFAACLVYSTTVKHEVICSSETSVDFHRTTDRYIP